MELCVGQVPEHTGWPATPHCAPGSPIAALVFSSVSSHTWLLLPRAPECCTVTLVVAVLFAEEGSAVVELTLAVSVSVVVPGAFTFTVNVIGPQLFPERSDPTLAQVNVPPDPTGGVVQFPFV